MTRRNFIKVSQGTSLLCFSALNFGCSIKPLVKDKNKKVAIVYATRYGATKDTAHWIADGLKREVDFYDIEKNSLDKISKDYDYFILGSGVWIDGVHRDLIKFVEENKEILKNKIIASFVVCGTTKKDKAGEERIQSYFKKFHNHMINEPILSEYFGGRIIIEELNKKDRTLLENFYKKVLKRKFKSWDRTEPKKALVFGNSFSKGLKLS